MKSFKYISIVLVALLTLVGCKEKMRELNTNSDLVDDTQVAYMFAGATQNFDWSNVRGTANYMNSLHKVMQYHVYYTSGDNSAYRNPKLDGAVVPSYIEGICYNELFGSGSVKSKGNRLQSILTYIDQNIAEADAAKYGDVKSICRGLLAYMQWRVLENYGATVYTEAFKAISEGITQPKYEYIQDVWKSVDTELKEAIQILQVDAAAGTIELGSSDFFTGYTSQPDEATFGATISSVTDWDVQRKAWLRFFNMARLEIAFKLAGREASNLSTVFSECQTVANSAAGNVMESVDDGFYFNYAHDLCCEDDMQEPESLHVVSDAFINFMIANHDPRLPYYARPTGATEFTSLTWNMMKEYFPNELAKYEYLDGKHPYQGISANPMHFNTDALETNGFIPSYIKTFNDLANPKGTGEFKYEKTINGTKFSFNYADEGDAELKTSSILVASETQNRYWVLCGARHYADHAYSGNGISGLGYAYLSTLHGDGDSNDEDGQVGIATRCRVFTYAKQCFMLAAISQMYGLNFQGKSADIWYNAAVQAAFDELQGEAYRVRIQALNGGDMFCTPGGYGADGHKYPDQLTQIDNDGQDWVFNFPYTIKDKAADYIAAHPYSYENLCDQIYAYGFMDPYTSYTWWKILGLPAFKSHDTQAEAKAETHAYLEQPYSGDGDKMVMPRRGCLPDKNTLNPKNYTSVKNGLMSDSTNPDFGDWEETEGRIWWDVYGNE